MRGAGETSQELAARSRTVEHAPSVETGAAGGCCGASSPAEARGGGGAAARRVQRAERRRACATAAHCDAGGVALMLQRRERAPVRRVHAAAALRGAPLRARAATGLPAARISRRGAAGASEARPAGSRRCAAPPRALPRRRSRAESGCHVIHCHVRVLLNVPIAFEHSRAPLLACCSPRHGVSGARQPAEAAGGRFAARDAQERAASGREQGKRRWRRPHADVGAPAPQRTRRCVPAGSVRDAALTAAPRGGACGADTEAAAVGAGGRFRQASCALAVGSREEAARLARPARLVRAGGHAVRHARVPRRACARRGGPALVCSRLTHAPLRRSGRRPPRRTPSSRCASAPPASPREVRAAIRPQRAPAEPAVAAPSAALPARR